MILGLLMHTWQLLPSRFYFCFILIINVLCGFELFIYLVRGYWWYVCFDLLVLYFLYCSAFTFQLIQIEKIAGRWIFTTVLGEQLSTQKLKIYLYSAYAIVLLISLPSGKKRILVIFSDQYTPENQHLLRWHLRI
jgi:hypothetical protein